MHSAGVYTSVNELLGLRHLAQGLALTARKESRALTDGNVKTRYRGRGMEFAEVRPYQPGDDIRTIDWRVTARVQSPYTKLFQEEHERPVFVLADQRSSMFFGSKTLFKSVFTAHLATMVAWIAQANNDRIGALVFGDNHQHDIRPRRGKHAVLDLINHLTDSNLQLNAQRRAPAANTLFKMLEDTSRVAKPGSMVILISDFVGFNDACKEPLAHLAKRSDVLAVHVYDLLEQSLPNAGLFAVSNAQQQLTVDAKKIGPSFHDHFERNRHLIRQAFINCGIQYVNAPLNMPFEEFIRDLFDRKKGSLARRRAQ